MKTDPDSLHRFLFDNAPVRGGRVHLDAAWQQVLAQHDYPPPLRRWMGELCAAAVLLAATLKLEGALVLQIQGRGAIRLLVVECSGDLKLRATAKWDGALEGTFSELVGDGRFVITLDPKDGQQAYQGVVALEGESIAEILQHYMARSEQLDTRLWLAADADVAAGLLLQKMPGESGGDPDAWPRLTQLAATVQPAELLQLPTAELLHRLYHEETLRLFDAQAAAFYCPCSEDSVGAMLKMLGRAEVDDILAEQGSIEVHCEFCNQAYVFDGEDVQALFSTAPEQTASPSQH